ncbi:MAG: hypothetical protein LBQ27_01660 [Clostridiales bacterium]|jgi:hypothetical protein|nr:hypothetical protein [Clostridiales bacterium]
MKKRASFKKMLAMAAVMALLATMTFTLAGCLLGGERRGESIDDFWYATVVKDSGGDYVRIWGLTENGVKLSETQTEAVIPETIGGYPVKYLKGAHYILFGKPNDSPAELGQLKRIIIEPCVKIGRNFFETSILDVLEFKSEEEYEIDHIWGEYGRYIIMIVPDNIDSSYTNDHRMTFKKSETLNGYLVRENIFCGYIGTEGNIVIPEGVTDIAAADVGDYNMSFFDAFVDYPIESIHFPTTVTRISKSNIFSSFSTSYDVQYEYEKKYASLTKVYVSSNTVIEEGAFMPDVEIEIY